MAIFHPSLPPGSPVPSRGASRASPPDTFNQVVRAIWVSLRLWFWVMALLSVGRGMTVAASWGAETSLGDVLRVLAHGLRFDARVATMAWLPLGALWGSGVWFPRLWSLVYGLHRGLGAFFALTTPILTVVVIGFGIEFQGPLSLRVLDFFYDETWVVVQTMVAEYALLPALIGCFTLGGVLTWWWLRTNHDLDHTTTRVPLGLHQVRRPLLRGALALTSALMVFVAARGSLGGRPAMRKWSAVTADARLNDAVLNPILQLRYAYKDYRRLKSIAHLERFLPDGRVDAAAKRLTGRDPGGDLRQAFQRISAGSRHPPPRHVFVVVMESMDSWPLREPYRALALTPELQELSRRGLLFESFLPGSDSTMASLSVILLGLPDAGVFTARQPLARQTYATALPATMRRLGYRTRGFYGGRLSWQQLGAFWQAQGMDEVYGEEHLGTSGKGWGADDRVLFEQVLKAVDPDRPSFNVILTLTNHPPFALDVQREGFDPSRIPETLKGPRLRDQHLGHLWYADRELGRFVERAERAYPDPLFVLVGDHPSRRWPPRADLAVQAMVPLVLYRPRVDLRQPGIATRAGGHIDISPTVIEHCAPAGFTYYALGVDLLADTTPDPWGIGRGRAISRGVVVDLSEHPEHPARQRHDDLHGVAWWWILRGPQL